MSMTTYSSSLSPSGLKYDKRDSIDEKYMKRRRQKWVAKLKQQQVHQKQFLIFGVAITVLFILCYLFFWGNPINSLPQRPPPLYSSKYQTNHRKHLREQSGDELSSSSDYASRRKKRHVIDDDDIGIKSKPADKEMLDEKMAQAIEDLKKFQKKTETGKQQGSESEGFAVNR